MMYPVQLVRPDITTIDVYSKAMVKQYTGGGVF